jgi:RNA polymerase sigma-70 factor (ECF subfamily)
LVLQARDDDAQSRRALEALCRAYRSPVLAYVRSRGTTPEEAEDLTQSFFARFIERDFHAQADPARGRFRAFLLTSLQRFLNDAHDQRIAVKRGGKIQLRSLDRPGSDSLDNLQSADSPERAFDRAWAQAVIQSAMRKLRREAKAAGKVELFNRLWEFVAERPDDAEYARVASELNLRRNTLAVAVHRLRNRLRELVRDELAETATDEDHLDRELDDLRHCLEDVLQ